MPHSDPIILGFFTEDAVSAYRLARAEAFRMGHPKVESDHLLLGLIAERHGRAAHALAAFGLKYADLPMLRAEVRELRPRRGSMDGVTLETMKYSLDVNQILEIAKILAQRMNPAISDIAKANTAHVLYAMTISASTSPRIRMLTTSNIRPAQELLLAHGLDPTAIRHRAMPGVKF